MGLVGSVAPVWMDRVLLYVLASVAWSLQWANEGWHMFDDMTRKQRQYGRPILLSSCLSCQQVLKTGKVEETTPVVVTPQMSKRMISSNHRCLQDCLNASYKFLGRCYIRMTILPMGPWQDISKWLTLTSNLVSINISQQFLLGKGWGWWGVWHLYGWTGCCYVCWQGRWHGLYSEQKRLAHVQCDKKTKAVWEANTPVLMPVQLKGIKDIDGGVVVCWENTTPIVVALLDVKNTGKMTQEALTQCQHGNS